MAGQSLKERGFTTEIIPPYYSVKEVVLPFAKFPGWTRCWGRKCAPPVKSWGGQQLRRGLCQGAAAGHQVPSEGRALLSVRHGDKERVVNLAAKLLELGYDLDATHGTAVTLGEASINPRLVNKVHEGRPHILDRIKNGEYTYIVNTAEGRQAIEDSKQLRRGAWQHKVAYTTTLHAAFATCMAISVDATANVNSVQELHEKVNNR